MLVGKVCQLGFVCWLSQPFQLSIFKGREIQLLVGIEGHRLGNHTEIHRLDVGGTFGDNHDVGPVLTADGFTKTT